jgi:hypothetical protein
MTTAPSRDDSVTTPTRCPSCQRPLGLVRGRQRYCSPACKQQAYRHRQPHPDDVTITALPQGPRASAIYQCPECDTRYLAEQRCPDCNTFCTRIGNGGTCPCCDELITLDELLSDLQPSTCPQ